MSLDHICTDTFRMSCAWPRGLHTQGVPIKGPCSPVLSGLRCPAHSFLWVFSDFVRRRSEISLPAGGALFGSFVTMAWCGLCSVHLLRADRITCCVHALLPRQSAFYLPAHCHHLFLSVFFVYSMRTSEKRFPAFIFPCVQIIVKFSPQTSTMSFSTSNSGATVAHYMLVF